MIELFHIATWEGDLYYGDFNNGLKQKQFAVSLREGNVSGLDSSCFWLIDYCGSFIQYCPREQVYVVSRAVGKELMIFDRTMRNIFCNNRTLRNNVISSYIWWLLPWYSHHCFSFASFILWIYKSVCVPISIVYRKWESINRSSYQTRESSNKTTMVDLFTPSIFTYPVSYVMKTSVLERLAQAVLLYRNQFIPLAESRRIFLFSRPVDSSCLQILSYFNKITHSME